MNDFKLDFVGIGSGKSGTSWIAECLRQHPQICMSTPKELNYFCTKTIWENASTFHSEGESWLMSRFLDWRLDQLRGEISPNYMIDPQTPKRIYDRFPDIKLIVSYRNPVDRLYSLYFQLSKQYDVPNTFEDFLAAFPRMIDSGFYYTQTKRFTDFFPLKQFHFILFDDILNQPQVVLSDLFTFLDVDSSFVPDSLHERVNKRKQPRSRLLRNAIGNTTDFLNSSAIGVGVKKGLRWLRVHELAEWLQARNLQDADFPPMNLETRSRLIAAYVEENHRLSQLLQRDLAHWNH